VFAAGHAPIYGTQSLYFRDPTFSARAKLPRPKGDVGLVGAAPPLDGGALWP
jgi:type IV secretion system protein VirD4